MIATSNAAVPDSPTPARVLFAEKLSSPVKKQIEVDIPGSDSSIEDGGGRRLAGARAESLLAGQMATEATLNTPKIQEICEGLTASGSPVNIQDGRAHQDIQL